MITSIISIYSIYSITCSFTHAEALHTCEYLKEKRRTNYAANQFHLVFFIAFLRSANDYITIAKLKEER